MSQDFDFDPTNVKREPYFWEEYYPGQAHAAFYQNGGSGGFDDQTVFPNYIDNPVYDVYNYVPQNPIQEPVVPAFVNPAIPPIPQLAQPDITPYEHKMNELNQFIQIEEEIIASTDQKHQQNLNASIRREENKIINKTPWMKNRPEARATTKFRQMQLTVRQKVVKKHYEQVGQKREMPKRAATAKLHPGAYREVDDNEIQCSGYFYNTVNKKRDGKRGRRN